jgi:hypothetical protein
MTDVTTNVENARAVAAASAALTVARVLQIEHGTFAVHGSAELAVTRRFSNDDDMRPRGCS